MQGPEVPDFYDDFNARLLLDYFVPNARVRAQYGFLLSAILEHTPSILIVGCGTGEVAVLLAERFKAAHVLGLDISPRNIERARALFDHPRVEYRVGDILAGDLAGSFEVVVFPDSYEHIRVSDRANLHAVVAAVLAPHGRVLLACPTPSKQRALREGGTGLQIIDEDVELTDVQRFAADLAGRVIHFSMVQVWGTYDYFHAVIERGADQLRDLSADNAMELHRGAASWRRVLRGGMDRLRILKSPSRTLRALRLAGSGAVSRVLGQHLCPVCGAEPTLFLPFGVGLKLRSGALCPSCRSLERHRLVWLRIAPRLEQASLNLLHVAPEPCFEPKLRRLLQGRYTTIDLDAPRVDVRASIEALPFPDAQFDGVICNHVLEHVVDDRRALHELARVLRPGGWAVLQVPILVGSAETREDPGVTTAAERRRLYGQSDHLRYYGADYSLRLRAAGFEVTVQAVSELYSAADVARYGLDPSEVFYSCRKP